MPKTLQLDDIKHKNKLLLAQNLPVYRKRRGLSQVELSEMAGITQAFYSKVELGKTLTSLEVYYQLSQILGLDAGALLREEKSSGALDDIVSMLRGLPQTELELIAELLRCYLNGREKLRLDFAGDK